MSDIFISYAREDIARAKVLAGALESQGWSVWWDREILPGGQFSQIIEEEIGKSKCVMVLWSKESIGSEWVRNEAREGARRKILVPVLIDDVTLPLEFSGTEAARLVDWKGRLPHPEFDRLLKAVNVVVGKPPKQPEPTPGKFDHPKTTVVEKVWRKSLNTKVLAAICIITFMAIISIGVFLKYSQPKAGAVVTNSIGMKLIYVPAGSFMMGSGDSATQLAKEYDEDKLDFANELPQHQVRISKGFWMGQTEVTQGQYKSVMNTESLSDKLYVEDNANNLAVNVNWNDAAQFCEKLGEMEGKTYRLPTEAEWEYACRAGTTTRFSFGDSASSLGDYAWFIDNTSTVDQDHVHPVGQKKPNPWGLYDMHGNVFEWCSDWYGEYYYSDSPSVDPTGFSSGDYRSLRGGSWGNGECYLRCSFRDRSSPVLRGSSIGFRVVRSQP